VCPKGQKTAAGVSGVACPLGIEILGMASPGEYLGSPVHGHQLPYAHVRNPFLDVFQWGLDEDEKGLDGYEHVWTAAWLLNEKTSGPRIISQKNKYWEK
jgi:hypothetical protein